MPDSSRAAKLTAGLRSAGKILRADSHADEAHACEVFATAMEAAPRVHPVDALKQCGVGMSVAQAHFILGGAVQPDGGLYSERVSWLRSREGSKPFPTSILNGEFTADELEAVATWMRAQAQT